MKNLKVLDVFFIKLFIIDLYKSTLLVIILYENLLRISYFKIKHPHIYSSSIMKSSKQLLQEAFLDLNFKQWLPSVLS